MSFQPLDVAAFIGFLALVDMEAWQHGEAEAWETVADGRELSFRRLEAWARKAD